jgi:hypothetical protein
MISGTAWEEQFMRRILCLLVVLHTGAALADESAGVREVIVVFKTHYDIGYTDLASKVVERYGSTMLDKALAVCEASRALPAEQRFVWTIPGWPMAQMLGPDQDPERRARTIEALRSGQFVTHALPFTTHTESLELEDLVRGLNLSSAIARECGLELPRDAKMTDVPSHSWVLPTLLKHAGVDFLHLGCNPASAVPQVPPLFWWEGPDGSRLLTRYDKDYGSPLVPPADWPYPVWLALIHTGDNHGPPRPEDVQAVLNQAASELPGVKLRMGRLSDFADALLATNPEIPVVRGDMPDTWIHGIMSMPEESARARRMRPGLVALEQADLLCSLAGIPVEGDARFIAEEYEHSLLFGEHTWGMDAKRFPRAYGEEWEQRRGDGSYEKLEASWEEKAQHVSLLSSVHGELTKRVADLAGQMGGIALFNPLPWTRAYRGISVPEGSVCFVNDYEDSGDDLKFDETMKSLENAYFRLVLDTTAGGIASWVDKRTGRELIAQDESGRGNYLYERFGQDDVDRYLDAYLRVRPDWAIQDLGKPDLPPGAVHETPVVTWGAIDFQRGAHGLIARISGKVASTPQQEVSLYVSLYSHQPYVDISCSVTKPEDPWPEAGWLSFAFALDSPRFLLGRLGGIVDPAKDIVPGANHDVYCINTGLAVIGSDGTAIGLCPIDSPLVSLGRPGLLRYSPGYQPSEAKVYVNLWNNVWGTNFTQWCEDPAQMSSVRLWVMDSERVAEDLVRNSWEARVPVIVGSSSGKPCDGEGVLRGLALSKPGVLVTAFGPNPDGEGIVLRIWEQIGISGECTITLPEGYHADSAQPCDLRGRPSGDAIPISDGAFTFSLGANAPASFLLPMPAPGG